VKPQPAATTANVHAELAQLLARQPYTVTLDGLVLTVDEDVFPPDLGRCARNMARIGGELGARRALDMGCGSGYLALALKQRGIPEVWAVDVHSPALACTARNLERNRRVGRIALVQSDLFEAIPASARFDLIAFNQPFAPGDTSAPCGCGPDGGYAITRRFLEAIPARLRPGGTALMAFSDRADAVHDPALVARELGYRVTTLLHAYYGESNNLVYAIRPAGGRAPAPAEDAH
jgi:release factor glutamine methyltransferase